MREIISKNHFISISSSNYFLKFHYYLQKFYKCELNIIKLSASYSYNIHSANVILKTPISFGCMLMDLFNSY